MLNKFLTNQGENPKLKVCLYEGEAVMATNVNTILFSPSMKENLTL